MTDGTILHALVVRQLMSVQTLGSTAVRGPWRAEIIQYLSRAGFCMCLHFTCSPCDISSI